MELFGLYVIIGIVYWVVNVFILLVLVFIIYLGIIFCIILNFEIKVLVNWLLCFEVDVGVFFNIFKEIFLFVCFFIVLI